MKENIIYIKPEEEITSVVDKLVKSSKKEIFLVIPKGAAIGQSLVNLKLLKREANNLEKVVTIVTDDETLERLAKKTDFLISNALPEERREEVSVEIEEEEKEESEDYLSEEKPAEEKEEAPERLNFSPQMIDIVQRPAQAAGGLFLEKIKKVSDKAAGLFFDNKKDESLGKLSSNRGDGSYDSKNSSSFFDRKPIREKALPAFPTRIFALFIAAALLIAALLFVLVLPKAEIKLGAKRDKILIDMAMIGDKNISQSDSGQNKIPAQVIRIEQRKAGDFPTTGERQLNEKAKGKITVFNSYSSSPQALVETTRFLSSSGKVFRLVKTTTIPGAKIEEGNIVASQIEVEVEADQPGDDFNIEPSDFTIPGFKGSPKYSAFYGRSSRAMAGGSTEKVKVLTQSDYDDAKKTVLAEIDNNIKQEIINQTPEGFDILEDSIQIQEPEIKSSVEVGGKAENFNMSIEIIARAFVFSKQDALVLIEKNLADQITEAKEAISGAEFKYKDVSASFDKGQVSFRVEGTQPIAWKINKDEIKNIIMGKTEADVRGILAKRPEVEQAQVFFWPFWVSKIPERAEKIDLTIE
ncbi:MAG: hypothetical protein PHQ47_02005 [Candidatus Portnoybacteria bacterium]|nr:hypothetical protein [Candidatus Portnoybacteria bacterium]